MIYIDYIDTGYEPKFNLIDESVTGTYGNNLFHLSENNLDGKTLKPRIPSNFLVNNGYENNKTKRVCFCNSVDGCLSAMSSNIENKEFYVHIPDNKVNYKTPSVKDVPDVMITGERWVTKDVTLKCIGKIKVGKAGDRGLSYTYGKDHTAELYRWFYKWEEKYDDTATESSKLSVSKPYFITSDDGVDNACVKVSGYKKPCRGRSSMLILKNEDGIWKVFFYKDNEKDHEYHAPGGGWNRNENPKDAAIREAREECMMNVKDVKYSGHMIEYHDKVADWVKDHVENEDDWWYGYYSEIFVGMYDSKFTGKIADRDKDKEISSGKWYNFDDIKDDKGLPKEYKKAIENYISDNSYVKESSIVTEISRSDIKDSTIERGDSCYNLDRWPDDYNILFITGISGSGKTTLGTSMAKEFKCRRVELDYVAIYYLRKIHEKNKAEKFYNILKSECPEAVEFLDKNPVEKLGLREKWSDTGDILTDFCKWFISKVEGNGNSYIVNGAYLYQIFEPSFFYDKPVIIKDINIVKTAYRRVMRELVGDNGNLPDKLVSGYKALKTALSKPYRDANKDFKHFNKDMKHNADYTEACRDRATSRDDDDFEIIKESILFNEKDIYYNKDKFDSGEINLCFITGHSGSGKSTMGLNATKGHEDTVDTYCLDDLQCTKDHFSMDNLREYGDLIYSFFAGPGKKYYLTYDELIKNNIPGSEYEDKMYREFVYYAMKYAKSHKNKKFIVEGVWLFCKDDHGKPYFNPSEFNDYAFYIKGTSMIISKYRAAKRDSQDGKNKIDQIRGFAKDFFMKNWKWYRVDEAAINKFRKYFSDLIKKNEKEVTESVSNPYVYCGKPCRGN